MTGGAAGRRRPGTTQTVVLVLGCIWPLQSSTASSWNRPAGQGLAILDYTSESGAENFDGRGRIVPSRSYAKGEASAYLEYGATDWLTLIARPSFDRVQIGSADGPSYRGLGSTAVGAQLQALVFGPAVLAVQGSFIVPGSRSFTNPALVGNTAREGEVRVLAGAALPLPFRPFLDLQTSLRLRSNGGAPQWHGDATFGFYPTERLLMLVQSFTTVPLGKGSVLVPSSRSTRLALSGVYAVTQTWAVQVGVSTTVLGQNALRAQGFSAGLWRYF